MPEIEGGSTSRYVSKKLLSKLVNLKMINHNFKFREVNGIFYFPELVPGSKSRFTSRNFTFSVHVAIWW